MKNQYFGDIGDYGKYGLLKFLAQHDVKIAVNWYLTKDEENKSGDGKFAEYLEKDEEYSKYDKDLYGTLTLLGTLFSMMASGPLLTAIIRTS